MVAGVRDMGGQVTGKGGKQEKGCPFILLV